MALWRFQGRFIYIQPTTQTSISQPRRTTKPNQLDKGTPTSKNAYPFRAPTVPGAGARFSQRLARSKAESGRGESQGVTKKLYECAGRPNPRARGYWIGIHHTMYEKTILIGRSLGDILREMTPEAGSGE